MEPQFLTAGTPVQLTWLDSTGYRGWKYGFGKHDFTPPRIVTRAHVVESEPEYLVLTSSLSHHNEGFLDPLVIPWGSILTLEVCDDPGEPKRNAGSAPTL